MRAIMAPRQTTALDRAEEHPAGRRDREEFSPVPYKLYAHIADQATSLYYDFQIDVFGLTIDVNRTSEDVQGHEQYATTDMAGARNIRTSAYDAAPTRTMGSRKPPT